MAPTSRHTPRAIPAPADDLCLRFVNTLAWRGSHTPTETLRSTTDLDRFLVAEAGIADAAPTDDAALAAALQARELMFRLLSAQAAGRPFDPSDVAALNAALAETPTRREVSLAAGQRAWVVRDGRPLLASVLWSAADLLLGPRAGRVRQCDNPECGWLFLDDSKSGNRRWCAMSACGNRAKARRHYARTRARAVGQPG